MNKFQYTTHRAKLKNIVRQQKLLKKGIKMSDLAAENIENIKKSILIIEKFFYAINSLQVGPPLRLAESMLEGMAFLNQMHTQLIEQLGPEEVAKMREQHKTNIPPPPPVNPQPPLVN